MHEGLVQVIHINAGSGDPVPWLVAERERHLRHGLGSADFRPDILDETAAWLAASLGNQGKYQIALGVLEIAHLASVHLRLDRMHDHYLIRSNNRKIAILAEPHGLQPRQRLLLRFVLAERAAGGHGAVFLDDAHGDVGYVHQIAFTFFQPDLPRLISVEYGDRKQCDQADQ